MSPLLVLANSTDDKIAQLERITNAHGQLFSQIQQQISANQQDINNIREQLDQMQFKLDQAVNKQEVLIQQFNQLVPESKSDNTALPANNTQAQVTVQNQPENPVNTASTQISNASKDYEDYNAAVNLILNNQNYEEAIKQLQVFISNYPKSDYIPNAYYWLGQSYLSVNNNEEAAKNFAFVVKNYPTSPKSSDALFKVGQILEEQGQKDKAKAIFSEVASQYAGTESAKKAQERLNNL